MSRRLALLISNNQYSDANLRKLAAPVADAAALVTVLRDPTIGAFDEVQTLINQPASDVRHAIAAFFHGKQPTDLLLLYFSGHGLLDERSRLYLATADTDAKLPRARAVEAAYIAQEMDDSRSKRQVLLLDCCHSGAFRQGITKSAVGQPVQTGGIFDGDGRVVLAASDATQYAFEGETLVGDGVRSVFTHYLVEGLTGLRADANHDGQVTVDELYDYLYPRVTAHTPTQTPVKWSYKQRGLFVLAGQGNSTSAETMPPPPTSDAAKAPAWRTWIVDQMYRGDFLTISEAISAAKVGDKIVIHRGIYNEGLIIDKPLEIEGEEGTGAVMIQATGMDTILFKAPIGRVRNLTLRQNGGGDWHGVDITQGQLLLEECDISSQSLACVAIHDSANPMVRNNRIHDGKAGGIWVYEQGQGVIEGNEIFANTNVGIEIQSSANPMVRNNRIHDGKAGGIWVYEQGQGVIEGNEIFANAYDGIGISEGANPIVRNNRIHSSKENGILVCEQGEGVIEQNEIYANTNVGIEIQSGANPMVRTNRIYDGQENGILVWKEGQGVIEENEIFANAYAGIEIQSGANPMVRNNRIYDGQAGGIFVCEQGQGLIEENEIFANAYAGIEIKSGANPMVRNNRIYDGKQNGIMVWQEGQGVIEGNEIFANAYAGIEIREEGNPTLRNNRINKNDYWAIWVYEGGRGRFEQNDLRDNQMGSWKIDDDCLPNVTRVGNLE